MLFSGCYQSFKHFISALKAVTLFLNHFSNIKTETTLFLLIFSPTLSYSFMSQTKSKYKNTTS